MDLLNPESQSESLADAPLARRMRPKRLHDLVGQERVSGSGSLIHNALLRGHIFSMILWGPPGCGKTTLAHIIAKEAKHHFVSFSAVLAGVKEIREVIKTANQQRSHLGRGTIVFVDEIHRFNKAQQDAFLQHVESGLFTLIGATTQNPSFEVIPALISRCRVLTLNALSTKALQTILLRALEDSQNGLGQLQLKIVPKALEHLALTSDGDARCALTALELTAEAAHFGQKKGSNTISLEMVETAIEKKALRYDKNGEGHYDLISAFHKSLRGSDPDASLYWLARMLAAGEDPLYIARRMVRFATEDIGNADPWALTHAMSALQAYRFMGSPEGDLALAQATVYLATAPKSNAVYSGFESALKTAKKKGNLEVPLHIRNAPTRLMKDLGYGKGYRYAHDYKAAYTPQTYLPAEIKSQSFYHPTTRGYEKTIKARLAHWRKMEPKKEG